MGFWSTKEQIDFVEDYFVLLRQAKSVTDELNNNTVKLIDSDWEKDISLLISINNKYLTTTTYIGSVLTSGDISYLTGRDMFKPLSQSVMSVIKGRKFDARFFDKKEYGEPKVTKLLLSELYDFDVDTFLSIYKKEKLVNETIKIYNNELLNISDNKAQLDLTRKSYSFKELMNQDWFYNIVFSTVNVFVSENLNNHVSAIQEILDLLIRHLTQSIEKDKIYTFILALNNKEFLKDCYELTKISDSIEFSKLDYSQQDEVLQTVVPKLIDKLLENMNLESENIKNNLISNVDKLF